MVFKLALATVSLAAIAGAANYKRVTCPHSKNTVTNEAVSASDLLCLCCSAHFIIFYSVVNSLTFVMTCNIGCSNLDATMRYTTFCALHSMMLSVSRYPDSLRAAEPMAHCSSSLTSRLHTPRTPGRTRGRGTWHHSLSAIPKSVPGT